MGCTRLYTVAGGPRRGPRRVRVRAVPRGAAGRVLRAGAGRAALPLAPRAARARARLPPPGGVGGHAAALGAAARGCVLTHQTMHSSKSLAICYADFPLLLLDIIIFRTSSVTGFSRSIFVKIITKK